MKILSIDTSCDETAVAITEGAIILSNIIWSQASLHAKWGGVVPSLAQREHKERIDWVIEKTLHSAKCKVQNLDAIAVTVGPGLAIALEVGISKAKELSKKYKKPFIPVNHIEGHLLSPFAQSKYLKPITGYRLPATDISFPALGVVTSGGHTEVILIKKIGEYKIIAKTSDDALGESLDKAARLLGFGYPGGAVLEQVAKEGNHQSFNLPIPMIGREKEMYFSYSGLKTAFYRLLEGKGKDFSKKEISDLAASYQRVAFSHFIRVLEYILKSKEYSQVKQILAGGGVMANVSLRKMLRDITKKYKIEVLFPYSKKLYTDNAAMIGIAAYYKFERKEFLNPNNLDKVERVPRAKVDKPLPWE
ncbi:MAG: putative tRNA threonylcarbamoyladenosine biosynthesis protein Gcp [Candidatus Woesebacteria bacterium GW2011_GWB1_38_8]|uniref:tRNA N6-adenosine threonylcarbamoyltransferase n=2 Tax=Candidatus Woeseibacteriota TaxID=1752722 RepID=A0A0G0P8C9_9BACT|nr:MAG: putative tRNA threonylcarbamoyladenosine biosynthesis protein Gcp [Candidatus Woesebacteria bacterium GW2011_GWB1_38_8]OGM20100.1 MAG: tRNA (adenosine(37)-N6)-threonylcarbamoyltransferase complex transferase subunit TsaD [Candidatus Woesebacteria bacterium RIFCSPHIGHO2_01_FULL_38_9b]